MFRSSAVCLLVLLTGVPSSAEDDARLQEALAFQTARKEAIRKAEPAITCILVSRSDLYRIKYNDATTPDDPCKLGSFKSLRGNPHDFRQGENPDKKLDLADPTNVPESYGSGVVVDGSKGLVLTNYHVIRDATKIFLRFPGGRGSYADIHAADTRSDLAMLRVLDTSLLPLPAVKMGNGAAVEKGDCVLTLANPFAAGFKDGSPSVAWGMVSNLRRRAPGNLSETDRTKTLHQYGTLMQLDTRLNLGCSGGAVVNLKGELIGLTTALAALTGSETSGGFAVPIDGPTQEIVKVLMQGKEVEYGFLGVQVAPRIDDRPGQGVTINLVTPGSPADQGQLRANCIIYKINGNPVQDQDDLFLRLGIVLAGNEARIEFAPGPNARLQQTTVRLAKFHVPGKILASNRPPALYGLRVDYTSTLAQRAQNVPPIYAGVIVREVLPASPAFKARLQSDKVITRVNDRPVSSPAEYYTEIEKTRNSKEPIKLTLFSPEGKEEKPVLLNPG